MNWQSDNKDIDLACCKYDGVSKTFKYKSQSFRVLALDSSQVKLVDGQGQVSSICFAPVVHRGQPMCMVKASGGPELFLSRKERTPSSGRPLDSGVIAPMSGKISKVLVKKGQKVKANEPLFYLEAMKMEHVISASEEFEVKDIFCSEGQQVEGDEVLLEQKSS